MEVVNIAYKALHAMTLKKKKSFDKMDRVPAPPVVEPVFMKNDKGNYYNCGFASAEIMPDDIHKKSYWMAGYNIANKVKGVIDPLTVSAMWLDCDDGKGIVLVSCDLVGFTGSDVQDIRNQLRGFSRKSGCQKIMISCTHTHAGIDTVGYWGVLPMSGKSSKFMLLVKGAIKSVVMTAYANRKKGNLYVGNIAAPELIRDGREPIFFNDKLTRLRFVPEDGSTETWYLNFCAHPNTMGRNNSMISADYPCYLRNRINEVKKTNVLFSAGAIGALDIAHVAEDCRERTVKGGRALGDKALAIDNDRLLDAKITVMEQKYHLPVENDVHIFMNIVHAISVLKVPYDSALGVALKSEMTYLALGDFHILALPGECFSELVWPGGLSSAETSATGEGPEICPKSLSEIAGDPNLVIFGVTDDMTGYIIPPNDFILNETAPYLNTTRDRFDRHHYNETNSVGYRTAEVTAATFTKMMEKLRSVEGTK